MISLYFLIHVIITLIIAGVLLYLEVYLSRKKGNLPGLLPIALILSLVIGYNMVLMYQSVSHTTGKWTADLETGNTAFIAFQYDDSGKIVSFSNLVIKAPDGKTLDEVSYSFNKKGKLKKNDSAIAYKSTIENLTSNSKLTGDSCAYDTLTDMIRFNDIDSGSFWISKPTLKSFLLGAIIPILPFLVVYLAIRWDVRKKERKEQKIKMAIKDL